MWRKSLSQLLPQVRRDDDPADPRPVNHGPMAQDRYVAALRRQRDRIASGLPLRTADSNAPGDRGDSATWGLCSEEPEAWPEEQDHVWPQDFLRSLRVAPIQRGHGQHCPFDNVAADPSQVEALGPGGCYYRCVIFQAPVISGERLVPDRRRALRFYDEAISEAEAKLGK